MSFWPSCRAASALIVASTWSSGATSHSTWIPVSGTNCSSISVRIAAPGGVFSVTILIVDPLNWPPTSVRNWVTSSGTGDA